MTARQRAKLWSGLVFGASFVVTVSLLAEACGSVDGPPPVSIGSPAHLIAALPNRALTPGAADPRVTQANIGRTICVRGYSSKVRPPVGVTEKIKRQQMVAYGDAAYPMSDFELDHLISLELGGAPASPKNLWPQPYERSGLIGKGRGSETKDHFENFLHVEVCLGKMSLAEAQREISTNWLDYKAADGA